MVYIFLYLVKHRRYVILLAKNRDFVIFSIFCRTLIMVYAAVIQDFFVFSFAFTRQFYGLHHYMRVVKSARHLWAPVPIILGEIGIFR